MRLNEHLPAASGLARWWTDNPRRFHLIHELGGLIVAYAELALNVADGAVARLSHALHRAVVERIFGLIS